MDHWFQTWFLYPGAVKIVEMAKVSIGLRGWRFEESAVLADDGTLQPLEEMPADTRERSLRLLTNVGNACDACWLEHEDDEDARSNAAVVYGEPFAEVLLCREHESDFLYWWREAGGETHRGSDELADAFHEWYLDGGRAPEDYGGMEHIETSPEDLPKLPDPDAFPDVLVFETGERIDLREGERENRGLPLDEDDLGETDLDLDVDYPG